MARKKEKKHLNMLDQYETELEAKAEQAKPLSQIEKSAHLHALEQAANNYIKKDKRISIRIYGEDLKQIRQIAEEEGLPYQTLITSVLHKFATGRLSSKASSDR